MSRTVNNFSGTCIRLLYSPLSGILCLHLFSLSPFTGLPVAGGNSGTQTLASFRQMDSHKAKGLKQSMYRKKRSSFIPLNVSDHEGSFSANKLDEEKPQQ